MTKQYTPLELAKILAQGGQGLTPGSIYRHIKGGRYMLLSTALRESDLEPMAIYAPLDAEALGLSITFTRPVAEFCDRFEREVAA
jgi:hypothetical protein